MRLIDIDELKRIELEILCELDKFCRKHKLRYYLCGGTLLGAIRHGGFIPWDDDIDVIMPRSDYMKLLEIYNMQSCNYKIHSVFNDKGWYSTFAELEDVSTIKHYLGFEIKHKTGVSIDIFPLDGSPNNYILRRIFWFFMNFFARISILSKQNFTVSKHYSDINTSFVKIKTFFRTATKFLIIPIARCTRSIDINRYINKFGMLFDVNNSDHVGVSIFPHYGYRECIKASGFLKIKERMFEGRQFYTPDDYDEYLGNIYGNYMRIPSRDKQVSHHNFVAYWKDDAE